MSVQEEVVRFINFTHTLQPLEGVVLRAWSPVTGVISHVTFHFPEGCNSLVGIRVLLEHEAVWPLRGFISLNNATPVYAFPPGYQRVKKNDPLECEMQNGDTENPHTVSAILTLHGRLMR